MPCVCGYPKRQKDGELEFTITQQYWELNSGAEMRPSLCALYCWMDWLSVAAAISHHKCRYSQKAQMHHATVYLQDRCLTQASLL